MADYTLETFRSDGTEILSIFRDAECRVVIGEIQSKWMVANGVLVSVLPNGDQLRDEVVSIANGKMTLHSLDDGTTYTREKAITCAPGGAA